MNGGDCRHDILLSLTTKLSRSQLLTEHANRFAARGDDPIDVLYCGYVGWELAPRQFRVHCDGTKNVN